MSSLWTPGGEHPVDPRRNEPDGGTDAPPLSADEQAQLAAAADEIERVRQQLAAAPAELVVANHVMGLYELAAIHLNRDQPDLASARLAIDALAAVLDGCRGRLGEAEPTLVDARSQLQMAFVNVVNWVNEQANPPTPGTDGD